MSLGVDEGDGGFFKHKNNHTMVVIWVVI